MSAARDKFGTIGKRVCLSPSGIEKLGKRKFRKPLSPDAVGHIVYFPSHMPYHVSVHVDGRTRMEQYHIDMWVLMEEPPLESTT